MAYYKKVRSRLSSAITKEYAVVAASLRTVVAANLYAIVTACLCAVAAACLCGCGAAPLSLLFGDAGADASGMNYISEPYVNNAIYNNDYVTDEGPAKGGGVKIYATRPDTYNPLLTRNVYMSAMYSLVYESLARLNPELNAVFGLAKGWTPSDDGLYWDVALREGVKWHDGRTFSAYDVADTISRIRAYGDECPFSGLISNIASTAVLSPLEIRLILKKENVYTPNTLIFPIIPSHVSIEALDGEGAGVNLAVALRGTGPYKYGSYINSRSLTLTAFDEWRGATPSDDLAGDAARSGGLADDAAPPYIREATFIFYEPENTALPHYRAGDIDIFFSRNLDYNRYKTSFELCINQYSEREFTFIAMNYAKGATEAKSVRRALARMIERQTVIDEALDGRGRPAEFPIQPEYLFYKDAVFNTPYDPQAARYLLDSAGFRIDEGLYYGDTGSGWKKLEIELQVNERDPEMCKIADSAAKMLLNGGITVNIRFEQPETILGNIAGGNYEMALLNYKVSPYPDMTELYSIPWFGESAGANPAHYENEEVDRLARGIFTIYDEHDRQTAFNELIAILQDDAPYIGLCFRASALVYGEDLRGGVKPCAWNPYSFFENWYIADYR